MQKLLQQIQQVLLPLFMIKAQGHVIFGSIFSASDFNSINNGIEDLVFDARFQQTLKSRT